MPHVDRAPLVPRAPGLVHLVAGDGPPNNWVSAFGGPAWTRDARPGRWYLHSFYPEQPDLDWRNPEVVAAMQDVLRFWLDRGVDGFRLDAIDRLLKDPRAARRPAGRPSRSGCRCTRSTPARRTSTRRNAPDIGDGARRDPRGRRRRASSSARSTCPRAARGALPRAPRRGVRVRAAALAAGTRSALRARDRRRGTRRARRRPGCCRTTTSAALATRFGAENERAAAMLLLTLPGPGFLYQGDEIGQGEGPAATRRSTAPAATAHRHPMQWDASPGGGFTTGEPWLPLVDPAERNVADQRDDPRLAAVARTATLIALRRELRGRLRAARRRAAASLAFRRGGHTGRDQHHRRAAARAAARRVLRIQTSAGGAARRIARPACRASCALG